MLRGRRGCRLHVGLSGSAREEKEKEKEKGDRRCVQQRKLRFQDDWNHESKGREHCGGHSMLCRSMTHSLLYHSMTHSMLFHSMNSLLIYHSIAPLLIHSPIYHSIHSLTSPSTHSPIPSPLLLLPDTPIPPPYSSEAFHYRVLRPPDSIGTTAPLANPILPSRSAPTPNRRSPRETLHPTPSRHPKLPFALLDARPELHRTDRRHDAKIAAQALAACR